VEFRDKIEILRVRLKVINTSLVSKLGTRLWCVLVLSKKLLIIMLIGAATYLCYTCEKIMGGHEIGRARTKLGEGGLCPPGLGLKPPLATVHPWRTDGRRPTCDNSSTVTKVRSA